jgi:Protein of unknown function (DUF4242)
MRREFLAELFSEADDFDGRSALLRRVRKASKGCADVRFVRSMFIPDDEMCFLVFEAESAAAVARLAEQALLPIDRVVRAELGRGGGSGVENKRKGAMAVSTARTERRVLT